MTVLETQTGLDELKTRLRDTWMTGDYGRFSRYMERDAEAFYRRLPIKPGAQLLDVGCGAGQLSLIAARAGARVTGCDIASNWLAQARRSAAAEGLTVVFEEGDAEALPYGDAHVRCGGQPDRRDVRASSGTGRSRAYPRVPARRDHRNGQLDGPRVRWADV